MNFFDKTNKLLTLPLVIAIIGLLNWGYFEYKDIIRKKNDDIEKRLTMFYYPLHQVMDASKNEWIEFRKRYGSDRKFYFNKITTLKDEDGKIHYLSTCEGRTIKPIKVTGKLISSEVNKTTGQRVRTYGLGQITQEGCKVNRRRTYCLGTSADWNI